MAAVFCADLRRSAMRMRMRVILTRDSVRSPLAAGMMGGRATCQVGWIKPRFGTVHTTVSLARGWGGGTGSSHEYEATYFHALVRLAVIAFQTPPERGERGQPRQQEAAGRANTLLPSTRPLVSGEIKSSVVLYHHRRCHLLGLILCTNSNLTHDVLLFVTPTKK